MEENSALNLLKLEGIFIVRNAALRVTGLGERSLPDIARITSAG